MKPATRDIALGASVEGEARDHHYVPRFLLRPWEVETAPKQNNLIGYFWDHRTKALRRRIKGVAAFCKEQDLLMLGQRYAQGGRDAIETSFFGHVDTKGALARDVIVTHGPGKLDGEQRCDFARVLLALEARRPAIVSRLRTEIRAGFIAGLDSDPEILAELAAKNIALRPSDYAEQQLGWSFEDRALAIVQRLTDSPDTGGHLINIPWGVKRLGPQDGRLVLSDRPLIRVLGMKHPKATWVLPLAPDVAFIGANDGGLVRTLMRLPGRKFTRLTNISSATQADRFVFSTNGTRDSWVKSLRQNARSKAAS